MKGFIITLLFLFLLQFIGISQNSDTDFSKYSKLLIGHWKLVDIEHTNEMKDTYASFAADCTYTMSVPCDLIQHKDTIHIKHQYMLDSDSLVVTGPGEYRKVIYKILKLTDSELILKSREKVMYKRIN